LISGEGAFITNPDESAVMQKNFFSELGLERYRAAVLPSSAYSEVIAQGDFSGTVPDYGTAEASGLSAGFNASNEHISALVRISPLPLVVKGMDIGLKTRDAHQ
jgi:hypothetical protein